MPEFALRANSGEASEPCFRAGESGCGALRRRPKQMTGSAPYQRTWVTPKRPTAAFSLVLAQHPAPRRTQGQKGPSPVCTNSGGQNCGLTAAAAGMGAQERSSPCEGKEVATSTLSLSAVPSETGPQGPNTSYASGSRQRISWMQPARAGRLQRWAETVVASKTFSIIMVVCTLYALASEDVRLAAFPKSADTVFSSLSAAAFVLFTAEIAFTCIARWKSYFMSFYFLLDVIATITLVSDIGWLWEGIVGGESDASDASAVRAGRASRAGTRASRIVRIVRLVRLIRIVKLFKLAGQSGSADEAAEDAEEELEPSKEGKRYSERTNRGVLLLVLALLFVIPPLDGAVDEEAVTTQERGLERLHRYPQDHNISRSAFFDTLQQYVRDTGFIAHLQVCSAGCAYTFPVDTIKAVVQSTRYPDASGGYTESADPDTGWSPTTGWMEPAEVERTLRESEYLRVTFLSCYNTSTGQVDEDAATACTSVAYFDNRSNTRVEAILNLSKTVFIMVLLAVGTQMFTSDAQKLVIRPIERMVGLVRALAVNPLAAVQRGVGTAEASKRPWWKLVLQRLRLLPDDSVGYETALLERTVAKIGALLHIGFGEAGAEIIAGNIGSGGDINPMVRGKKIWGVYAFCDIRKFTDTTECLQEDVMVFVNTVGAITHGAVHQFAGAPNKNIGDAFLFVWKLPDYSSKRQLLDKCGHHLPPEHNPLLDSPKYVPSAPQCLPVCASRLLQQCRRDHCAGAAPGSGRPEDRGQRTVRSAEDDAGAGHGQPGRRQPAPLPGAPRHPAPLRR